jgi:hypothetical protein
MLDLKSNKWKTFDGSYRNIYDASKPLIKLESLNKPSEEIWNELWEELYHQGDVGIASYVAIPQLFRIYREKQWIDFQLPNFTSAVERARFENHNPKLPEWLTQDYFSALHDISQYCLENVKKDFDEDYSRAVLLLMAILLKDLESYELLDKISIGDEEKVLELYYENV